MKKILFSLFIFVSMLAKGQDPVPVDTAYHHVPTYSFKYYTKDSSVWIQKGPKYGTTKLVSNKRLKFLIDSLASKSKMKADSILNPGYFTNYKATGKINYHGIQTIGAYSFDNSTHVFTVAAGGLTYWNQGQKYTSTAAKTCDLDDATLVTNKLYFIYFADTTGVLTVSQTPWNWYTHTFVATVYWNGSEGAIQDEDHDYRRNIAWQKWAHYTIGTRYSSGLSLTAPTAAVDATLTVGSGTIYDEDQEITIASQSTMRGWYKTSAAVMTYTNYSFPYLGTSGAPVYLDTDTYALTTYAANRYSCYWVYASNDITRPIYVIPSQVADPYISVALARTESVPDLSLIPINSEMKIIYRYIYSGDGQFQEVADYRGSSPLPAGGAASTTAGAVSFSPYGNISSTTVQAALQELDDEKKAKNDSVLNAGFATNYKLLSYKLKNDSVVNSGFYTNYKASILNNLANNTFTRVYDYAGNLSNMWKLSKDNIITPSFTLGVNKLFHVQNSGVNEIVSIPLSTASTTGTEHGVEVTVGSNKIMKVSAKVSATGTADTARVTLSSGTKLGIGRPYSVASVDIEAGTTTRTPLKLTSGDTLTTKVAGAIEFKNDTYYGTITTGTARRQFAFLQNPLFKDTVTTPNLKILNGKGLGKIPVSDANGKMTLTSYTQGLLKTSATGIIAPLAHGDAGKYLQSNGATSDPTWVTIVTSSGDFLDAVLGMQQNATLNPSLTTGNRYIILDAANLHSNFGTINKNMAGAALTLGNGDIVQYTGSEFRIAFDASAATTNVTVLVTLDKNGASSHDWTYGVDTDTWVDRGSGTLHNSLSDLNTGAGTFYHLTQAQNSSGVVIKSDTASLVATKTNIALYKLKTDSTANSGYASVWDVSQKRALNDHDSLSTLQERSYNSLTDKPTLTSGTVTSIATGLGLSGGTITSTGTLLVDTASTSILSRQRAFNEYAPIIHTQVQTTITALPDSLLAKYTKTQSDGRYQGKAAVLTNIQDSLNNRYRRQDTATVLLSLSRAAKYYELKSNKVTSISSGSTDVQYPTAKLLYDQLSLKSGLILANNTFQSVYDYAGNVSNLFKLSKDNVITPAYMLGVKSLWFVRDQENTTIASTPVTSSSVVNTEHGYKMEIDSTVILNVRARSTGAGKVDSARIETPSIKMTEGAGYRKIPISRNSLGLLKYSASTYLDTTIANRLLIGTASNVIGQLSEGGTGKILRGVTSGLPVWSTPTFPNTATSGKVLIGDGTNIVLSTPTFPNASATFGKMIKSDGTNWVASTETYAAPGTSGNGMISDGTNWTSAAIPDIHWDGGSTGLIAATGRTSLGGSTIGQSIFTLTNPSAITFLRMNADNTATALSATDFRSAIGAGTSSTVGTVTSVTANSGLLGGTITSSGTISVDTTYVLKKTTAGAMYQPLAGVLTHIQDSLNNRYRRQDTATVILSRVRASHDYQPKGSYENPLTFGLGLNRTVDAIKVDTANVSILSRQRAANTYQIKGSYLVAADIAGKKDISDSTASDGYTRRDRLATELFKKLNGISNNTLSNKLYYPTFYGNTSGATDTLMTSSSGMTFNPAISMLTVMGQVASPQVKSTGFFQIAASIPRFYIGTNAGTAGQIMTSGGALGSITWSDAPSSMTWPANAGIAVYNGSQGWGTSITDASGNWNTAYDDRLKWSGTSTGLNLSAARTSLELNAWAWANNDTPALTVSAGAATWNINSGLNARVTLSGDVTITLSNVTTNGMSGTITVVNDATARVITFAGYTNKINPSIRTGSNQVTTSGGSKIDLFSWYWDGTYLFWNGSLNYN